LAGELIPFLVPAACLAYLGFLFHRWLKRRAAFRAFASARGLRFRGTIPSDKYVPYAVFDHVSRAVLLHHVVEGPLNGFDIALFDFPKKTGGLTGAIVSGLPVVDAPEPPPDGELSFERQDGHLLGFQPEVPIENVPAFLESVMAAARRATSR
jgi:hypothetical protein